MFPEFGGFLQVSERTPAVRDRIVRAVSGVTSAAHVTKAHLAAITDFYVALRNSVKVGDFDGLTGLTSFSLGTGVTSLPAGLFKDLNNVTVMEWLDVNSTTLPRGTFTGLTSLDILVMEARSVTSLPAGVFNGLTNLTDLTFHAYQLRSLSGAVFAPLTNLTDLNFHIGQLTTLPDGLFSGLSSLKKLDLDGNAVDPMPLTVSLKKIANGQFKAVAPTGAPFDIVLPITVTNGNVRGGATSITIAKGSAESGTLTVTRTTGTTAAVTVNIGTLPGLPSGHSGYTLVKSTSGLPLTLTPAVVNNPPVFTAGTSTTRSIVENTASGQNIGTAIAATDADSGNTLTYTLGGTDAASFSIVSTTGQLQTKAALDFETKTSYTVTITVSDGNGGSDTISVTINVTDIDETPLTPVNQRTPKVRDAIVNVVPGINSAANVTTAHLAAITGINLRNAGITELKTDDFSGMTALTSINLFNNQLVSLPAGIFEGLTSLTTLRFGRNLVDPLPLTVSLEKVGTNQFRAVAPAGATFDYILPISVENGSITGGATQLIIPQGSVRSNVLTVVRTPGTTGHVTVNIGTLPSLPRNHYGYALVKSNTLPLKVIRGANSAPVFTDGTRTTRSIAENTASGQNIGTAVAASDADNDTLTYTLGGIDAATFSIVSTTGQLQTKAALDYETKTTYAITITVSDGNGGTDSIAVTINITDVQENRAPVFTAGTSTTRTIAENTASGQNIGAAITATDADSDTLTYTLGGTDAASFSIVSTSGQLQTKAALDYETKTSYAITITVSDGNGSTDSITVTVNVTDVNESATGTSTSTAICKVGDVLKPGQSCTYPDTDAVFSVLTNGKSQWNIPNLPPLLQWINQTSVGTSMNVSATVNGVDYHFAAKSVPNNSWEIKEIGQQPVTPDPEDTTNAPTLSTSTASTLTEATLHEGVVTLTLSGGTFKQSKFTIRNAISLSGVSGLTVDTFGVERVSDTEATVELVFNGNMTTDSTLTISLDADGIKDYDGAALTSQISVAAVTETITASTAADLTEATLDESTVTLTLSGRKYERSIWDIRGEVSVSGISGATVGTLDVDRESDTEVTAELTYNGDMTTNGTLTFTVDADAIAGYNGPDLTTQINVTATGRTPTPTPTNNPPVFTDGTSTTRSVPENTASGTNIGTAVAATDANNDTLTYSLGGTDAASFSIVSTSGQLQTKATLDFETKSSYSVTVSVSDGNGGTDSITVTINVTDVNETSTITSTLTLSVSTTSTLTEATLHGAVVSLNLSNGTFASREFDIRRSLTVSGITDADIDPFSIVRVSDTKATVELEFDGNMTTNGTLTFELDSDAIVDYDGSALTSQISVSAVTESITASTTASLTESTLDESVVTLTLSGRKFERSTSTIRLDVSVSGISGVTVRNHDIDRESDTEVTVELTYNGNMTSDGTLTFTVGADAIAGYDGSALTAQISVSAGTAPVVPEDPETPVVPEDPETPVVPEDPETPVVPEDPETPQEPQQPQQPQEPQQPQQPQEPQQPQQPTQPSNTGGTPTLSLSTASTLTEATLHGAVVSLKLSGGTFESRFWDLDDEISVSGITGVTYDDFFDVDRISDTKVDIELSFNSNMTANGTLTFTVESGAIVDYIRWH